MAAVFFVGHCTGNIIGPQTFRSQDAPRFVSAEITIIVLFNVSMVDMLLIYAYFHWLNKKAQVRSEVGFVKQEGI